MAPSKTKKKDEKAAPAEELDLETEPDVEVVDEVSVEPGVGVPASAPGGPVPGRKSLGVKEPIVFKWKVVGRSEHMNLTLFKSVEREEAEAQLERLTRDGYYTHLSIMEASAKVDQPPQPKESKKAKAKQKEKEKPAKAVVEKPAAKSTPIRIPGRASDFKKGKPSKRAAKATRESKPKATKSSKAKAPTRSKKVKKK